jgi:hypothetical protein
VKPAVVSGVERASLQCPQACVGIVRETEDGLFLLQGDYLTLEIFGVIS